MAKTGTARNIILSLKEYIELNAGMDGWTNLMIVPKFPNDEKIVLPEDYQPNMGLVRPPALSINILNRVEGERLGLGDGGKKIYYSIGLFFYCISEGQLIDLKDYLSDIFDSDITIPIYDYSDTGYPSTANSKVYDFEINPLSVKGIPRVNLDEKNPALRYGGMVSFVGSIIRGI